MRQEDGPVDDIRHLALRRLGDIVAEGMRLPLLVGDIVLAQPVDGVGIAHAPEGAFRGAERGVQGLDEGGGGGVGEDDVDDGAHDLLEVGEQVVEEDEVELGFDVGVLGEVAAGEGFLGAEGGRDAEDVAERGEAGLEVELRGLRQVGGFAVVGEGEERGAAFDLGLHHAGRGDFEAGGRGGLVGGAEGAQDRGADFHDGGGVLAAEHEVPVVEEGLRVSVFGDEGGDGFFVAGGAADDLVVIGVQLAVVGGVLLGRDFPHFAPDLEGGFEGEGHGVVGFNEVTREHALQEAVAVLECYEDDVFLRAEPVDAAGDSYAGAPAFAVVDVFGAGAAAKLDVLGVSFVEANFGGFGEGWVFGELQLLGQFQSLLSLLCLLLFSYGELVAFGLFSFMLLVEVVGLLQCAFRRCVVF